MHKEKKIRHDLQGHVVELRDNGSRKVSMSFEGQKSKTEQCHSVHTDINVLIEQYAAKGYKPTEYEGIVDHTRMLDYQSAMNIVTKVDEFFLKLPSKLRDAYGHEPARLLHALEDPGEVDRLINLGVLERKGSPLSEPQCSPEAHPVTPAEGGDSPGG